jgi:hypothetical protein
MIKLIVGISCISVKRGQHFHFTQVQNDILFLGTLQCPQRLIEFSRLGTYCQFDLFGTENSYYQVWISISISIE